VNLKRLFLITVFSFFDSIRDFENRT